MYSQWPLTPGAGQFRILVLHPQTTDGGGGRLHGSLVVANLKHEKGRLETLSYVWGSSTLPRTTILVDRTSLQITASLGSFLRYLRRNDRPLRLWADGICINQEDDEEKSEQVALMADIYKSCSQVNVWLPDPNHNVGTTPRNKSVGSLGGLCSLIAGDHFHDVPGYHVSERTGRLRFTETAEFDALWNGFFLLANSSWWTRAWTAQEAFLPPRVIFLHYATDSCDIKVIDASHERLWQHRDRLRSCCTEAIDLFPEERMTRLNKFYQAFAKVQHRREVLIGRRSTDGRDCFYNIVTSFSSRQCHDARDRIYSLWSMTPSFYKDCPLDYAIPEGVVFTSVFECMLREAKLSRGHLNNFLGWGIDYRFLQWMNFGPDSTNVNCRPSWVPDFSKSWSHEALHANQGRIGFSKLYQPSGWSRGYFKVQGRQLHLKGFPMDKVRVVGKTVDDPTSPESLKKALSQWSCLLRESGFADKTTDVTFHEQLATLLCADIVAERMPDDEFAAWRRKFVAQRIWKLNILATIFEYAFNVIARSEHSRRLRAEECPGKEELQAVFDNGDLKCFSDGRYRSAVSSSLNQRELYITERGRIGLCLPQATAGDGIWGVYGFRVPFVFRA